MTTPAPGWYPDPLGDGWLRLWDGTGWTDRVLPSGALDAPGPGTRRRRWTLGLLAFVSVVALTARVEAVAHQARRPDPGQSRALSTSVFPDTSAVVRRCAVDPAGDSVDAEGEVRNLGTGAATYLLSLTVIDANGEQLATASVFLGRIGAHRAGGWQSVASLTPGAAPYRCSVTAAQRTPA